MTEWPAALASAIDLSLTFETMRVIADPQLTLFVYTPEVGSKPEEPQAVRRDE